MAYRPSKRAKRGMEEIRLNITPIMNLMVVLIPLLIGSVEYIKLGIIELNLPPEALGPESEALAELPQEDELKLDLTVTITDQGFFISSGMAVLSGKEAGKPTIPIEAYGYDFNTLSNKLYEIKQKAKDRFPDHNHIIIMAEPDIDYQTIVSTMDAARARIDSTTQVRQTLFPVVSLSAGIF